jgi:dTDP-4-dehydrorhamnose 3,5-epimerase-like enzyme
MDYKITQCVKHTDQRGYLVEFLKEQELSSADKAFGQIYFVTFEKPNQVRGNHFHTRISEWFGVAHGTLRVILEDTVTKERVEFILSSDDKTFTRLTIGPKIAHAFQNVSPTAVLLYYSNTQYNSGDNDRNSYILIPPA